MARIYGMILLVIGSAAIASSAEPQAPEIDPASMGGALALLGGVVLVIRANRRR